ncbi:MAG: hypothetical protein CL570_04360 [Alphaproteobacteria bacterium]|nr:hypothetical protein [Alphaproteobacteria bacterium]|tara:strand:+ start:4480 stop:6876 length:2397 start_codon:yes stop_codon:yes gene_type:complete
MTTKKKPQKNKQFSLLSGNIKVNEPLDDELRRKPFAKGIAKLITASPQDECFVIGIEGAWGEGKSYAIDLIRREIEEYNQNESAKPIKWMVFNPWHFTDNEHLASLFLRDLATFIEREVRTKPIKFFFWLKNKLKPIKSIVDFFIKNRLARRLALFGLAGIFYLLAYLTNFIPQISIGTAFLLWLVYDWLRSPHAMEDTEKALIGVSDLLRDYADILEDYEDSLSTKTLDQLKKEVQKKLGSEDLPFSHIVVAIEDLDRLNPEEVRSMVQLMRMIADFPKVIYLVGYDRKHVINALGDLAGKHASKEEASIYGEGYLQKVVQAAYQLPRPADHAIASMTFDRFYKMVSEIYGSDFNQKPYWQRISPAIATLFTSLRVGERVINRSLHMVTMLENKSDPADILVASYLMEYQPELWDWLWLHRNAVLSGGRRLVGTDTNTHPLGHRGELPEEGYIQDQIRGDKETKEKIVNILRIVFPALQFDNSYSFSDTERESFRMGIPDFMEMYFKYEQNPATEIPEIVSDLLKARSDKGRGKVLQKVRAFGGYMPRYVIRDLKEHNEKEPFDWQTQALPLLRSLGKNFDNEGEVVSILMFAVELINSQPEKNRPQALSDLLSHWISDGVIYLPMHLFEKAAMENGHIEYDPEMSKSDYPLNVKLTESDFTKLKEKVEKEISLWARHDRNERWLEHNHAAPMLFMWLRLNAEEARRTLDEWVANDRSLIELLNTMMNTGYTYDMNTGGGAVARYGLSKYGLKKLIGLDTPEIQARVNDAVSNVPYITSEYPEVIRAVRALPDRLPD